MFAEHGVGAATVEQIASAAGFTRGAFYSNFATKDELVLAMLEDHVERSIAHNLELLAEHPDTESFVEALRTKGSRAHDPLHDLPLLHMELILYVARTPEHRPALAEYLRSRRMLVGEIVVKTLRAGGLERDIDVGEAGALLVAVEDGLRLHRLIDPSSTPPDAFVQAVQGLQALLLTEDA